MPDATAALLLHQILQDARFRIHVVGDGAFVHVVHQREVEIPGAGALQLMFENGLHVEVRPHLVAGHLGGHLQLRAVIPGQRPPHEELRAAVVVGVGGIHVGDAAFVQGVENGHGPRVVDIRGTAVDRQPHGAETQRRDLFATHITVNHGTPYPCMTCANRVS